MLHVQFFQKTKIKKKKISTPSKQKSKRNPGKVNKTNKQVPKKKVKLPTQKLVPFRPVRGIEDETDEDFLEMVEKSDLDFLKKAVVNRSYTILSKIKYSE